MENEGILRCLFLNNKVHFRAFSEHVDNWNPTRGKKRLDVLIENGFVIKHGNPPSKGGGKKVFYSITEQGRQEYLRLTSQEFFTKYDKFQSLVTAIEYDPDKRKDLNRLMDNVNASMTELKKIMTKRFLQEKVHIDTHFSKEVISDGSH